MPFRSFKVRKNVEWPQTTSWRRVLIFTRRCALCNKRCALSFSNFIMHNDFKLFCLPHFINSWTFARVSEEEKVIDMKWNAETENILDAKSRPFFENTSRHKQFVASIIDLKTVGLISISIVKEQNE